MSIAIYTRVRVPPEVAKKATAAALNYDESKITILERFNYREPGVYLVPLDVDWDVEGFPCEYTIEDPTDISNYPETWSADMERDVTDLVFARVWSKVAGVDVLAQVLVGHDEDEWFVVHPDGTEELFEMPENDDEWDPEVWGNVDEEENEDDEADE